MNLSNPVWCYSNFLWFCNDDNKVFIDLSL